MLESEIKNLTAAIVALNSNIELLINAQSKPTQDKPTQDKPTQDEPTKDEPTKDEHDKITKEELQRFCLSLVRKNPNLKQQIKDVIEKTGHKTITNVDDSKLAELHIALKGLDV